MKWIEYASESVTRIAGSSWALLGSVLLTVAWFATGPVVHFSDSWQLVYNTITSIVTFVMVFIIQRDQNKQTLVLQTKLNELLAAGRGSNRLINIESMTEEEIKALHSRYQKLAAFAATVGDPHERFSVEHLDAESGEKSRGH
jgi:low affinity Fe/Cu permease